MAHLRRVKIELQTFEAFTSWLSVEIYACRDVEGSLVNCRASRVVWVVN